MFITGPDVIKTVTGQKDDLESIGGAMPDTTKPATSISLPKTRRMPQEHPAHSLFPAPEQPRDPPRAQPTTTRAPDPQLDKVVPDSPKNPYDIRHVVRHVVRRRFFEVQSTRRAR